MPKSLIFSQKQNTFINFIQLPHFNRIFADDFQDAADARLSDHSEALAVLFVLVLAHVEAHAVAHTLQFGHFELFSHFAVALAATLRRALSGWQRERLVFLYVERLLPLFDLGSDQIAVLFANFG